MNLDYREVLTPWLAQVVLWIGEAIPIIIIMGVALVVINVCLGAARKTIKDMVELDRD